LVANTIKVGCACMHILLP